MPRALRAWLISPSEKNSVKRGEMFIISPGSNRGEELIQQTFEFSWLRSNIQPAKLTNHVTSTN